jgi:mono/diheme cytochrome c family protein
MRKIAKRREKREDGRGRGEKRSGRKGLTQRAKVEEKRRGTVTRRIKRQRMGGGLYWAQTRADGGFTGTED